MHLIDDMCIVENVDEEGAPVRPGESGLGCSLPTCSTARCR